MANSKGKKVLSYIPQADLFRAAELCAAVKGASEGWTTMHGSVVEGAVIESGPLSAIIVPGPKRGLFSLPDIERILGVDAAMEMQRAAAELDLWNRLNLEYKSELYGFYECDKLLKAMSAPMRDRTAPSAPWRGGSGSEQSPPPNTSDRPPNPNERTGGGY